MDVDRDLICVVGPNAAGKSSFLAALTHLDHDEQYSASEITRNQGPKAVTQVGARFVLEDEDKALLADIPEAKNARQFVVWKRDPREVQGLVEPAPERDAGRRRDIEKRLKQLQATRWFALRVDEEIDDEVDEGDRLNALVEAASQAIHKDPSTFEQHQLASLIALLGRLQALNDLPHRFRGLPARLEDLVKYESQEHPHSRAIGRLMPRKPRFLLFDDAARDLNASYDLNSDADEAIENLLRLGGTSWERARGILASGDKGRKTAWLDRVNARLAARITADWGQGNLTVRIDMDGSLLTILMRMQSLDFIDIDQQSDGLRQFIALRAFVALEEEEVKPIVLIDEAETHLHYDAQADLVQVLEQQNEAAKVIYTTHSAGCLPHDLGTGVRAIVPAEATRDGRTVQTDHSRVVNSFWTQGAGYFPLLIAMGASAFAFSATQRAAVGEGMSEAMLLPSLLREATGRARLPYQVAPHFAQASKEDVPDLDLVAARVAYVADGDEGGRSHVQKLRDVGVLEEQILFLGGSRRSGLSLEDLLVKDVYLHAVNEELDRWHPGVVFPAEQLPDKARTKAVADWCKRQRGRNGARVELSKVAVAQRVLDQRTDRPQLVAPRRKKVLRELDAAIETVLSQATHRIGRSG